MQSYLAAMIGRYRQFVRQDTDAPPLPASQQVMAHMKGFRRLVTARASSRTSVDTASADLDPTTASALSLDSLSPPASPASAKSAASAKAAAEATAAAASVIRGDGGAVFYHTHFVASFLRASVREFAASLWDTQHWHVFIRERLALAAAASAVGGSVQVCINP